MVDSFGGQRLNSLSVSHGESWSVLHGSFDHVPDGHLAPKPHSHSVQFYEDDSIFLDGLSEFVGATLGAGGACIVIATEVHRAELAVRLRSFGIDLTFAIRKNRYVSLDAEETLAKFMVKGWPDQELFYAAIEPVLVTTGLAIESKSGSLSAFGEMVALLWKQGNAEAAVRLEQLWNELAHRHAFSLRCAYPLKCFSETQEEQFQQVCVEHNMVIPTETYTSLATEEHRLRMVSSLQHKEHTLEAVTQAREREITKRKQVEVKLRQSEQFAQSIVESSIDCVKVLDLDGRLEYMSPQGQRALEINDESQFLGRRWIDFWKDEDRPRAEAAVAAARAGGIGSFQGDCPTLGGVPKSWDVKITPVLGSDGEAERLIGISRDITALKSAQAALMQSEKLAAAGRLAATVAHEINNPLEAVTNFIYLAKSSPGISEEISRHLEIADQELRRVAQIAQQTLGFYRDNTQPRWIAVAELIQDVTALYERRLRYKRLEVEVSANAQLRLHAKAGELRQVLANLVANAIDASTEGGRLLLRAHPTKNWTNGMEEGVRITLADTGEGMTPETQRRIFVPFFTTKADVGTGIGLWMTKSLIEKQGGYMSFRSKANVGTVMSFFLPVSEANHANARPN